MSLNNIYGSEVGGLQIQKYISKTSEGNLQYSKSGIGKPIIVLINGGAGPIEGWMKILPEISKLSSVFSYNCLGGYEDQRSGGSLVHAKLVALYNYIVYTTYR